MSNSTKTWIWRWKRITYKIVFLLIQIIWWSKDNLIQICSEVQIVIGVGRWSKYSDREHWGRTKCKESEKL